jgi:hypothetical protein
MQDSKQKSVLYLIFFAGKNLACWIFITDKKKERRKVMTHLEKYSEDIAKIACSGELFGVMQGDDSPVSCRNAICQNCLFYNARPDPDDWCSQNERRKWSYSEC